MKLKICLLVLMLICLQTVHAQTWVSKVPGGGLGNPLTYNPLNSNYLYGSSATSRVYVSRNRGTTWLSLGNQIAGGGIIKSIAINPLDTLQILAAVETGSASADKIMKSTDGGFTWSFTWGGTFSYYGQPIEHKPVLNDTVYTMGSDTIWRSTNFGTTWDTVTVISAFTTWCDAEQRPDSTNIMYIGDNSTGIWKTVDYGENWKKVYATSGEIPSIAVDPLSPNVAYATKYAGGGGLVKTTDGGESWFSILTPVGSGSTWWIVCSPVHAGFVYFGTYGSNPAGIYLSRNGGLSWQNFNDGMGGSGAGILNYGLLTLDSLTVIALQNNGIYKLQYPSGIHITSPNGGEQYPAGSQQTITWTDSNVTSLRIQYTTNGGTNWNLIADNIPNTQTSYNWTLPVIETNSCRVRIYDITNTSSIDTSDSNFSIISVVTTLNSPNGGEAWNIGTMQNITWTAVGPANVDIHYSTNNGASWIFIAKRIASSSSYAWNVANTPSTSCKVRIRSDFDSTKSDDSDTIFTIKSAIEFVSAIIVQQGLTTLDTLMFGVQIGATNGIDTAFNEMELLPKPGADTFDVRWSIPGTNGIMNDNRDTVLTVYGERLFVGEIQAGTVGYPVTLRWDPLSFDSGVLTLEDTLTHGSLFAIDMKKDSSYTISDTSIKAFEIVYAKGLTVTVGSAGGWNLMALPVRVINQTRVYNFPNSTSSAYNYIAGYQQKDTLEYGTGYWIKMDPVSVTGRAIDLDTIDVHKGWNMVGSLSYSMPTSFIQTIPETLISSYFWEYSTGGYNSSTTILPGRGYWIKSKNAGKFIFTTNPTLTPKTAVAGIFPTGLNSISVTDFNGNKQSLFFGEETEHGNPDFYEMPPVFSENAFDVRFATQNMAEFFVKNGQNEQKIQISALTKKMPIIFSWSVDNNKNFNYILVEKVGHKVVCETPLLRSGSLKVSASRTSEFSLRASPVGAGTEIPKEFQLGLNYPNPFNPTTRISYALPLGARLSIKVFSTLGQEVATLFDGVQTAGIHEVEWNGNSTSGYSVSSGMYFVRLTAARIDRSVNALPEEFTGVRKIMLLK